ncbi:methyltransferase domain-containing protein [Lentzea sp. NPDC051838]|uniref:methyltransferase domain-containing protein n=1 Tax=Lentzea sp. NPDC051838 TaxID=3154849 RepID=UPI0034207D3E
MLDLARHRLPDADLRVADLAAPLPYADNTFDDVTVSLVLHYLEGLGAIAGRTPPRPEARWPAHGVGRPPVRHPRDPPRGRPPHQLLRDLQLDRGLGPHRRTGRDVVLEPAAARDDRRVHRGRVRCRSDQRTAAGT